MSTAKAELIFEVDDSPDSAQGFMAEWQE